MEYQLLARTAIVPSPLNPRKSFDPAKLHELALSMMNGVGIIEPLVVRPLGKKFELIAGERRWRAAEKAGVADVPVVIRDLTDAQVLEIMVIENNQREGIAPLEEAAGYQQLLKLANTGRADDGPKLDVDVLAHRLGRSRKYVYDRIKLLSLIPDAQELLALRRITAGHAILLARLTPAEQKMAIDPTTAEDYEMSGHGLFRLGQFDNAVLPPAADLGQLDEPKTKKKGDPYFGLELAPVRNFQEWIRDNVRLKPESLEAREEYPALAAALEKSETIVNITHHYDWESIPGNTANEPKVYGQRAWRRADGRAGNKKCPAAVTGLVVVGRDRGDAFPVCVDEACKVHFPPAPKAAKSSSSTTASASHKRYLENVAKERKRREARDAAWKLALPEIRKAVVRKIAALSSVDALMRLIVGMEYFGGDRQQKAATQALGLKKLDALGALRVIALGGLLDDLERVYAGEGAAKRAGVDVKPLLKKAQTSAQMPKSKPVAKPKKKAA